MLFRSGIATQALVTTPVLEHFGVGLALAILPAALWACLSTYFYSTAYAHMLPTVSVWIIMSALLLDKMLRPNLHRPAESCLVAALSPAVRPTLLRARRPCRERDRPALPRPRQI